jgi:hypothetical protein
LRYAAPADVRVSKLGLTALSHSRLAILVICGERSLYLIARDGLADIKPSFKDDTNIVPIPPREPAFSNCAKGVERDVEVYRNEA